MDGQGPIVSSDDRAKTWLTLAAGVLVTAAAIFALVTWWPSGDDGSDSEVTAETATTRFEPGVGDSGSDGEVAATTIVGQGEPSRTTETTAAPEPSDDLFGGDFPAVYGELLAAAGNPTHLIEAAVYPDYAFLAYRDPANPGNIDRRMWRSGEVDDPSPNPIDDRVDASTEPQLFGPGELDPGLIAGLVADAPSRYDIPVAVTHILIDRFLPFDERVLIRVYASPTDGRSGGGYVSYDTAGTFVDTCC